MGWVSTAIMVLELIPALIKAILAIEEALPEGSKGAEKLALVREIITELSEDAKEMWPLVEKIISKIVTWFNKMGIFKTSKRDGD